MPEPRAELAESQAILIGVARYQHSDLRPLPAAINSLNGMYAMLIDPALGGWSGKHITRMPDPKNANQLSLQIRRIAKATKGTLLLYYVGHGILTETGELVLTVVDTDTDEPDLTGVEYEMVRRALRSSPARVKIAILDCCYAGEAIQTLAANHIADSTMIAGVYTLTAADRTAHVVSLAEQTNTTTSFTRELLGLIHKGIHNDEEWLTLGALFPHLRTRLDAQGLPKPNQRGTDTADRFRFTRNVAYQPISPVRVFLETGSVTQDDSDVTPTPDNVAGEPSHHVAARESSETEPVR